MCTSRKQRGIETVKRTRLRYYSDPKNSIYISTRHAHQRNWLSSSRNTSLAANAHHDVICLYTYRIDVAENTSMGRQNLQTCASFASFRLIWCWLYEHIVFSSWSTICGSKLAGLLYIICDVTIILIMMTAGGLIFYTRSICTYNTSRVIWENLLLC